MGKIPNGLQQHVLFDMDDRQWIENIYMAGIENPLFQMKLEKGWVKIIPQDKLEAFIASLD